MKTNQTEMAAVSKRACQYLNLYPPSGKIAPQVFAVNTVGEFAALCQAAKEHAALLAVAEAAEAALIKSLTVLSHLNGDGKINQDYSKEAEAFVNTALSTISALAVVREG